MSAVYDMPPASISMRLEASGSVHSTDRTVGVVEAGGLTVERLSRILEGVEGLTELVCHPGLGSAQLAAAYDWGYDWEEETEALTDPALPGLLRERGISLGFFSK